MSQIISAAKRSVRKKSGGEYEDLDKSHDSGQKRDFVFGESMDSFGPATQELEMNSVSVVPDGE